MSPLRHPLCMQKILPLYSPHQSLIIYYSDVSRDAGISIQCYLRTEEPKRGGDGIADDMGNDIPLARVEFTPVLDGHVRTPCGTFIPFIYP